MNGQMCVPPPASLRSQMSAQVPMARHPSREQLIDYLMLKVSQQPPGPPCPPRHASDTLTHEVPHRTDTDTSSVSQSWSVDTR